MIKITIIQYKMLKLSKWTIQFCRR